MAQQQQKGISPKRNKSSPFAVTRCQAVGLHKHWCPSGAGAAECQPSLAALQVPGTFGWHHMLNVSQKESVSV